MKETAAIEMQHVLHDELPPDLVPAGRDRGVPRRPTTDRMEPSATPQLSGIPGDIVERLSRAATLAILDKSLPGGATEKAVRAVLAELAAMGIDDALPSESEIAAAWSSSANEEREVRELCRSRIVPVLAAKDAEITRLRAGLESANDFSARGARLAAMLNLYGLPDEPKALARAIERERAAAAGDNDRLKAELARAQAAPGGLSEEAIAKVNAAFRGEKPQTSKCPAHEPESCSICR